MRRDDRSDRGLVHSLYFCRMAIYIHRDSDALVISGCRQPTREQQTVKSAFLFGETRKDIYSGLVVGAAETFGILKLKPSSRAEIDLLRFGDCAIYNQFRSWQTVLWF
jgi:hypothetical protein